MSSPGATHGMDVLKGSGLALGHGAAWALARVALTLHILLHASLLHAEGDLGVLVAEQDVCNTCGWIARGVQMLAAITQAWMLVISQTHPTFCKIKKNMRDR